MKKTLKKLLTFSSLLIVLTLLLVACQPAAETTEEVTQVPSITNPEYLVATSNVVVDEVYMDQAGWVVIHADDNGAPGPVIGYFGVEEGMSTEVVVPVTADDVTDTLYAMLHVNVGNEDEFEFPDGDDVPVTVDGDVVVVSFDT